MPSAMPSARSVRAHIFAVLLAFAMTSAIHAQTSSAPLPAAPVPSAPASKPATSIFALPPNSPDTLKPPPGPPPSAPVEDQVCDAPATGIYAPQPRPSPAVQAALPDYIRLVMRQIETKWSRNLPRAANDPWIKPKTLYIRFAVRPDGSYTAPIVTVSSGRRDFDNHALDSIDAFSAFPAPPPGITLPVPICIHFQYNVDQTPTSKPIDLWPPKPKS